MWCAMGSSGIRLSRAECCRLGLSESMKWIEMIGASGVGKSYYGNQLATLRPDLDPSSRLRTAFGQDRLIVGKVFDAFVSAFPMLPARLNRRSPARAWHEAQGRIRRYLDEGGDSALFGRISKEQIDNLCLLYWHGLGATLSDPTRRLLRVDWYVNKRLTEFLMLSGVLGERDPIVFDDGVIHNNDGFTKSALESSGAGRDLPLPSRVIYFTGPVDRIHQNRLRRRARHDLNACDDLRRHILSTVERCSRKIELLADLGVEIVGIEADGDDTEVLSRLLRAVETVDFTADTADPASESAHP